MSKITTAYLVCDGSVCGRDPSGAQLPVTSIERIEGEAAWWLDQHDPGCRITVNLRMTESLAPFVLQRKPRVVKG